MNPPAAICDPIRIARLDQSIASLVEKMRAAEPEQTESAIAARGLADAAAILARRFTLQTTNVPFLARSKMVPALADFVSEHFRIARSDLSTVFLVSMFHRTTIGGAIALVSPQNWYLLGSYRRLRELVFATCHLHLVCDLGPAAFYNMNWWAARTALTTVSPVIEDKNREISVIDASQGREPSLKATALQTVSSATD